MTDRVAGDPATPVDRLTQLTKSRSREIRRTVAANPNASVDDLDVLCRHFPNEVAVNPVLDWWTLTDADWLGEFSAASRHRLLSEPSCPPGLLWWAATFGEDEDRLAAAANRACPTALLTRFANVEDNDDLTQSARLHVSFVGPNEESVVDSRNEILGAMDEIGETDALADLLAGALIPNWVVSLLTAPTDVDARRALARHPATSALVLATLLGDDDEQTRIGAAANPSVLAEHAALWDRLYTDDVSLNEEELRVLSSSSFGRERCAAHSRLDATSLAECVTDPGWRVREMAARNPALNVDQAATLASDADRDVRAAAAMNAALPLAAVRALTLDTDQRVSNAARRRIEADTRIDEAAPTVEVGSPGGLAADVFEGEFAVNDPLLVLLRRSRALTVDFASQRLEFATELAAQADTLVRVAVARNPSCPESLHQRLALDDDALVRRAIAAVVTEADMAARLIVDIDSEVRANVAANPSVAPWLALRLADDTVDDVRIALLNRPDASVELVAKLTGRETTDASVALLCSLLGPDAPSTFSEAEADAILILFTERPWVSLALTRSPELPAAVLSIARRSPDWRVRQGVAGNPHATVDDLRILAADNDNDVRAAVATNPSIRPELMANFFSESDDKVRRALVSRADLTTDLLEMHLVSDDGIRSEVLAHPNLSEATRADLRALTSRSPIDPTVLSRFAQTSARRLVVSHPDAPTELLHECVRDTGWTIREAVANHRHCGPEDLRTLADDSDRDVRSAVAANPQCPVDVLIRLAAESDARVCRAAGSNRQSPAELRAKWARSVAIKLLANPSWVTRTVALLDPNASPLALRRRRHASSVYWLERFAVAVHPSTTDDVRDALKDDANRIVAAAARGEVGWPQ